MYTKIAKPEENKSRLVAQENNSLTQKSSFIDNRSNNVKQLMLRRTLAFNAKPSIPVAATAIIPWVDLTPRLLIGEGQERVTRAAILSGLKDPDKLYFHIKDYWSTIKGLEGKGHEKMIYANKKWIEHMSKYGVGLVDMGKDGREDYSRFYQAELDGAKNVGASLIPADPEIANIAKNETKTPKIFPTPKKVDQAYQDLLTKEKEYK